MRKILVLVSTHVLVFLSLLLFNEVVAIGSSSSASGRALQPCWKNLTSWYGTFHSPNHPGNYSSSIDCYWLITVARGNAIEMTMNDLAVEWSLGCQKDYIAAYDGPTKNSPLINTRLCGSSLRSDQRLMTSSRNVMFVHMHSDSDGEHRGFNASYQGICHLNITSPYGEISSPYFPGSHSEEAKCNWLIDRGIGYYITLGISARLSPGNNTDCKSNYIQVQEARDSYSTIQKICGGINTTIVTRSPMRILFAKERNQGIEFKAHYNTIDIDECSNTSQGASPCHENANCINNIGSFTCACKEGYTGDGKDCSDNNECLLQSPCHSNAQCINKNGSFTCECRKGYRGSGLYCQDINECMERTHTCRQGSICINKEGIYTCPCRDGYYFDRETTKCLSDALVLNKPEESDQPLSPEVLAGIVITIIILFLAIIAAGGLYYWKRYKGENTFVSEEQGTTTYARNSRTTMVSQNYDFCNLSFSSVDQRGPKLSFDTVTSAEYPARLNESVEDHRSGIHLMKSHTQHEMALQQIDSRLQIFDDQRESIEV